MEAGHRWGPGPRGRRAGEEVTGWPAQDTGQWTLAGTAQHLQHSGFVHQKRAKWNKMKTTRNRASCLPSTPAPARPPGFTRVLPSLPEATQPPSSQLTGQSGDLLGRRVEGSAGESGHSHGSDSGDWKNVPGPGAPRALPVTCPHPPPSRLHPGLRGPPSLLCQQLCDSAATCGWQVAGTQETGRERG